MSEKTCPRCGERYSTIERRVVGGNTYYYAVHYYKERGRRRVRKCYLGAKEYHYVTKMHMDDKLVLKGLTDQNRLIEYLNVIIDRLVETGKKKEVIEILKDTLRKIGEKT